MSDTWRFIILISIAFLYWIVFFYCIPPSDSMGNLPIMFFIITMCGSVCALFGQFGGELPEDNSNQQYNANNQLNDSTIYSDRTKMNFEENDDYEMGIRLYPQEDYDPAWDPYFKWMPNNKWHDEWLEENNILNENIDNSNYDNNFNEDYCEYYEDE